MVCRSIDSDSHFSDESLNMLRVLRYSREAVKQWPTITGFIIFVYAFATVCTILLLVVILLILIF